MQVARYVETRGREGIWMLIVEIGPRHGKTKTVSEMFPPWFLGRNPDKRVMLLSYGATLAYRSSRRARAFMDSPLYRELFGITLDPHSKAVDAWNIEGHEGGADAMGVLGGATGKGADLLVADDLVKNREEAESEIIRDKTWEALSDDLMTRLEPGGAVVLFATRWHQDDAIGRMKKLVEDPAKCNGPVEILTLASLIENARQAREDPLQRAIGQALWPDRYPTRILEAIRDRIGSYSWSALYQQEPVPAEGGLFKRANFNRITVVPECSQVVRFWDLAMSEKTTADYSVGTKMGMGLDGRTKVLDVARRQIEWDELIGFMADTALRDGPDVVIGFEEKGYMSRAGQALATDSRLHNFSIFGYPKDTDKVTNALPFASRVGLQMVDVLEGHWTETFIDELCGFPKWTHDDQVDSACGAYEMLGSEAVGALNVADSYEIGVGDY